MKHYKILLVIITIFCFSNCSKKSETVRIACIGASNTSGFNLPNLENDAYPGQLRKLVGDKGVVENFGVGGTTVMESGNFPYKSSVDYQEALVFDPNIVIVDFGWNDLRPENRSKMESDFVNDYVNLIDEFKAMKSKPKIYITLPPLYEGLEFYGRNISDEFFYLMGFYTQIIEKTGAVPIDLYTPMAAVESFYLDDKAHYSIDGCKKAAEIILKAVMPDSAVKK